jgi:hypothetical protein
MDRGKYFFFKRPTTKQDKKSTPWVAKKLPPPKLEVRAKG